MIMAAPPEDPPKRMAIALLIVGFVFFGKWLVLWLVLP